jgi:hypothetical protein
MIGTLERISLVRCLPRSRTTGSADTSRCSGLRPAETPLDNVEHLTRLVHHLRNEVPVKQIGAGLRISDHSCTTEMGPRGERIARSATLEPAYIVPPEM